ncbi:rhodanese-like domain-containing protein [Natrarchaeobius halalkaliphilus]|uniref:Rhodanese-like domain-containing protein n=1 Tax=Natrarchaeobius halalkaliphilus TaxID=1679091 RepID=A0A3N6N4Q5_9EURY|nr:rhodanese-like domain-containing protein [Natrarchaeobius halalkaliphilus]RQG93172.1 rhodanese-like domain-containing protein [Natrarchaeobius halalkaliphilus]
MERRKLLVSTGALAIGGVAGCLDGDDQPDESGETTASGSDEQPVVNGEAYPTMNYDDVDVPLAPLEDVYEWYDSDAVSVVDTRSEHQYEVSHIAGAALSPAPTGPDSDDPVEAWDEDGLIVTYCVCPHAMAVQRAAALIQDGYENVYALDEGFNAWIEAGYPLEGDDVDEELPAFDVQGRTDPAYEGEFVWIRDPVTGQREPGQIDADGRYEMTLYFTDVDDDTVLEVDGPEYTHELTLAEITSDVITA